MSAYLWQLKSLQVNEGSIVILKMSAEKGNDDQASMLPICCVSAVRLPSLSLSYLKSNHVNGGRLAIAVIPA